MSRKILIDNEKIIKSINAKDEMSKRVQELEKRSQEMSEEGHKIEEEFNTIVAKCQREDEKVKPEIERLIKEVEMSEFEELSRVYLEKEGDNAGKIFMEIADRLEEFKVDFKRKKDEESKPTNSSDSLPTDGGSVSDTGLPAKGSEASGD